MRPSAPRFSKQSDEQSRRATTPNRSWPGGLKNADSHARAAAARGLESLFRLNSKPPRQPATTTLAALHEAFAANRSANSEEIRELILLTMRAAGDHDSSTLTSALADVSPGPSTGGD
jgi:hypothetical protein